MKKFLIIMLLFLIGCAPKNKIKSPNNILLSIKNYSCKMQISYFSNKNQNNYIAAQAYSSDGKYTMEYLDSPKLKISYENSNLVINSNENLINLSNYNELNKNPLFLSYFINTYFNIEKSDKITSGNNFIEIKLPNNNPYLYSAKLVFNNNKPYILSYFDKNGNEKVNILYTEFTFDA